VRRKSQQGTPQGPKEGPPRGPQPIVVTECLFSNEFIEIFVFLSSWSSYSSTKLHASKAYLQSVQVTECLFSNEFIEISLCAYFDCKFHFKKWR
jgi:hypothetical protein